MHLADLHSRIASSRPLQLSFTLALLITCYLIVFISAENKASHDARSSSAPASHPRSLRNRPLRNVDAVLTPFELDKSEGGGGGEGEEEGGDGKVAKEGGFAGYEVKDEESLADEKTAGDESVKDEKNAASSTTPSSSSFKADFAALPWESFKDAKTKEDRRRFQTQIVDVLTRHVMTPPPVPINASCSIPPPLDPTTIDCSRYPQAFLTTDDSQTGSRRSVPAKIGHAIQFGFEADVLEAHLNELHDVVDRFFILESTLSHKNMASKPLVWERVRDQPRFRRFADKIVHLVIDDAASLASLKPGETDGGKDIFNLEALQERARFEKVLEWNRVTKVFARGDVIGFGDADEVPSRGNVQLLKACRMAGRGVDVGIWFPYGRLDQAFSTDWPVPGNRYTLGDPTFFEFTEEMVAYDPAKPTVPPIKSLSRNRGTTGHYLVAGMHMTHYGYFPNVLIKELTGSEYGFHDILNKIPDFIERAREGDVASLADFFAAVPQEYVDNGRIVPIDRVPRDYRDAIYVPWFLACNPNRYPRWRGLPDPREAY